MKQQLIFSELEKALFYTFEDISYLKQALTRRSAVNVSNNKDVLQDNQRLEFLGDKVLNLVIAESLMELHPKYNEGQLTEETAKLVRNNGPLLDIAREINLGYYLIMDEGESTHNRGKENPKILADTMEAIIGAIYVDSKYNVHVVKAFIIRHWKSLGLSIEAEAFKALDNNNASLLKGLLKLGTSLDAASPPNRILDAAYGNVTSLLSNAIARGNAKIVELLLKAGANPNEIIHTTTWDKKHESTFPLHIAAWGSLYSVGVGLNGKRDIDISYGKIVELLLHYKADINAKDSKGETPLFCAAACPTTMEVLLKNKADVMGIDQRGKTILHRTMVSRNRRGISYIFSLLLKAGADKNAHDNEGYTPLHDAIKHEKLEVVKLLVDAGADIQKVTLKEKYTPLHLATLGHTTKVEFVGVAGAYLAQRRTTDYYPITEILIKKGADLYARDELNRTPYAIITQKISGRIKRYSDQEYSWHEEDCKDATKRGTPVLHHIIESDYHIRSLLKKAHHKNVLLKYGNHEDKNERQPANIQSISNAPTSSHFYTKKIEKERKEQCISK